VPVNELLEIDAFDEETVEELRTRARNALLTEAIKREEGVEQAEKDLLELDGMDTALSTKLAENAIRTRDDLAELAVDELTEMTGIDDERAKTLIMAARAHWFADEAQEQAQEQVQEVAGR
jgi:N utilization substance protein A